MKKILLLLAFPLVLSTAFAQKTNQKLIVGKWNIYAILNANTNVNTDSLKQSIAKVITAAESEAPEHRLSKEDSLKIVESYTLLGRYIDSSFIKVKKRGKYYSEIYFIDNKPRPVRANGTYKWMASDTLLFTDPAEQNIFTIQSLTAKEWRVIITGPESDTVTLYLRKKKCKCKRHSTR